MQRTSFDIACSWMIAGGLRSASIGFVLGIASFLLWLHRTLVQWADPAPQDLRRRRRDPARRARAALTPLPTDRRALCLAFLGGFLAGVALTATVFVWLLGHLRQEICLPLDHGAYNLSWVGPDRPNPEQ